MHAANEERTNQRNINFELPVAGDEENEDIDLVVMAIDIKDRGKVGCCYYRDERLYLGEDNSCGGLEVVEARECFFSSVGHWR